MWSKLHFFSFKKTLIQICDFKAFEFVTNLHHFKFDEESFCIKYTFSKKALLRSGFEKLLDVANKEMHKSSKKFCRIQNRLYIVKPLRLTKNLVTTKLVKCFF